MSLEQDAAEASRKKQASLDVPGSAGQRGGGFSHVTICGEFRGSASPLCVINFFTAVVAPQLVANMSHFFALRWYHVVRKKPWGPCAQNIEPERTLKLTNTHTHKPSRLVVVVLSIRYLVKMVLEVQRTQNQMQNNMVWPQGRLSGPVRPDISVRCKPRHWAWTPDPLLLYSTGTCCH